MESKPERYGKPSQSHSKRSLIIAQPDLATGKTGIELRGGFWNEESPVTSYFRLYYDEKKQELHLELNTSPFAEDIFAAFESELGKPASTIRGEDSAPTKLHASWSIPRSDAKAVGKRIGQAIGADWAEAVEELVRSEHPTLQPERKRWHGIPRESIPWFPMIDTVKCDGCCKCLEFCRNDVFRMTSYLRLVEVANPLNCVVGCDLCADKCPRRAIQFPPRDILRGLHLGH